MGPAGFESATKRISNYSGLDNNYQPDIKTLFQFLKIPFLLVSQNNYNLINKNVHGGKSMNQTNLTINEKIDKITTWILIQWKEGKTEKEIEDFLINKGYSESVAPETVHGVIKNGSDYQKKVGEEQFNNELYRKIYEMESTSNSNKETSSSQTHTQFDVSQIFYFMYKSLYFLPLSIFFIGLIFDINFIKIIGGIIYILAFTVIRGVGDYMAKPTITIIHEIITFLILIAFIKPWYMGCFWASIILFWFYFIRYKLNHQ